MIDQVPIVWVGAAILVVSFLYNVAFGRTISDYINAATLEVSTPWRRPSLLSGRLLVALWFASALLYGISLPTTENTWVGDGLVPLLALMLFLLMCTAAISYRRSRAHQADSTLDERERSVRNELYLFSYRVVASTVALIWISLFAAFTGYKIASGEDLQVEFVVWENSLGYALILISFVAVLPNLVDAWLHPLKDDEIDTEHKEQWALAKHVIKEELKDELAELRREIAKEGARSPKAAKAILAAEDALKRAERYLAKGSRSYLASGSRSAKRGAKKPRAKKKERT